MTDWEFHARLFPTKRYPSGVVDGDTMHFQLDLGFYMWFKRTLRLGEIDTHEISFVSHDSEEYERGMEEYNFVKAWFTEGEANYTSERNQNWPFKVITKKYDSRGKYGRVVCFVQRKSDGEMLNERLLEEFDDVRYQR